MPRCCGASCAHAPVAIRYGALSVAGSAAQALVRQCCESVGDLGCECPQPRGDVRVRVHPADYLHSLPHLLEALTNLNLKALMLIPFVLVSHIHWPPRLAESEFNRQRGVAMSVKDLRSVTFSFLRGRAAVDTMEACAATAGTSSMTPPAPRALRAATRSVAMMTLTAPTCRNL